MGSGNIFDGIPGGLDEELFETLAKSRTVKIERIVSRGHSSPQSGWYDQDWHEWVIVLRGSASILFEDGKVVDLEEGGYLEIGAHMKHRVIRTSDRPETVWLAVHFAAGSQEALEK